MYYGLIMLSVIMFSGSFALNDEYRKRRGSGLSSSFEISLFGSLAGLIILFISNGFKLGFTWFTLLMALLSTLVGIGFTFCSLKALEVVNLSLYSLFSMLGGMVLPFLQGIIFYSEKLTLAKILCLVFIIAALCCTVERGKKKKGVIFYIGIFVLNGMSGVIAKIFTEAELPKASGTDFSIWIAVCTALISLILWTIVKRKEAQPPLRISSVGLAAAYGGINRVANLLLVLSLAHVDASIQYPMVTGGSIIVSTLICCFGKNKPKKNEIVSVVLAFIGLLLLFLIKI